jgi:hypothetical protein
VEHAGQTREEFVAENEVHVLCERDGVGDDGGKNVGGAEEIKKEDEGRLREEGGGRVRRSQRDSTYAMSAAPDTRETGGKRLRERLQDRHTHGV